MTLSAARTTNVTAALFSGKNETLSDTLKVHPDKVKKWIVSKKDLSPQIYQLIFAKEHSQSLSTI